MVLVAFAFAVMADPVAYAIERFGGVGRLSCQCQPARVAPHPSRGRPRGTRAVVSAANY
ncbi:hypothetical protein MHPYR_440023 [uncultured Mycobacterium sp.]|uniref:Uncharacterized protein n=1 Tax=uncultured Mycobacterium sp. TaxID=171292 RepID=A0A1Y5PMZ1_9MYCO|nr:hypothetical protein MHPYR_440023 [uncultured Mycobacterium sp.]